MTSMVKSMIDRSKTALTVHPETWLKAEFLVKRNRPHFQKSEFMDYLLDKRIEEQGLTKEWLEFRKKWISEGRIRPR